LQNTVVDDPEIATRISQYEMAFQMQASVPGLMDIADEPESVLRLYGTKGGDGSFAANCLLARRLAERGVRFIQLYHRDWDHHGSLKRDIQLKAEEVDQASAALVTDLKQRGLLEDTLIVWGGEFGRTPMAQGNGRDHHIKGFSIWLAGGGIKGGITHGCTDELGYNAVEDVVSVHDLHATLLYLLGVHHKRLTYRFQGRDFRLTDVSGEVVEKILVS
jgi:arylsulfatase A-like enzyme